MRLLPHQKTGICFLYNKKNAILGDEMGLGKSLQALMTAKISLRRKDTRQVLIVCPATLITNWKAEFKKWMGDEQLYVYHGPNRSTREVAKAKWILTSYSTLHLDLQTVGNAFDAKLYIVCDEAHELRRVGSTQTIAVRRLMRTRTLLVTGTPIENRPDDLYSLLDLIIPDVIGTQKEFFRKYIKMGTTMIKCRDGREYYKEKPIGVKDGALHDLREILHDVMIRREKKNTPDFPQLRIQYHPYELDRKTSRLYRMVLSVCEDMELGMGSIITRLRQVLDGVIKTEEDTKQYSFYLSAKARLLAQLLSERSGPIIVWFNYVESLNQLSDYWADEYPIYKHTGKMSVRQRNSALSQWRESTDGILFASIKSAGRGLNLIEAKDAIFYSYEYTPSANKQARERIHRIGQKHKCTIHYLYGQSCLEAIIIAVLKRKERMAESIVGMKAYEDKILEEIYEYTLKLINGNDDISLLRGL